MPVGTVAGLNATTCSLCCIAQVQKWLHLPQRQHTQNRFTVAPHCPHAVLRPPLLRSSVCSVVPVCETFLHGFCTGSARGGWGGVCIRMRWVWVWVGVGRVLVACHCMLLDKHTPSWCAAYNNSMLRGDCKGGTVQVRRYSEHTSRSGEELWVRPSKVQCCVRGLAGPVPWQAWVSGTLAGWAGWPCLGKSLSSPIQDFPHHTPLRPPVQQTTR